MNEIDECVVLLDNGSLRPEAVLSLRRIAADLSRRIGAEARPVSLLHSSKIPVENLDGAEAETWQRFLRWNLAKGVSRFRLVPLFFGPSAAFTDYLPKVTRKVSREHGPVEVAMAKPLVDLDEPEDNALARILEDLVIRMLDTLEGEAPGLILVDHGSPLPKVAACRDLVASQLAGLLGHRVKAVLASSMERREGPEYDFNEPLLERALEEVRQRGWRRVVLSYLFFSPGRHAGPGGDIDQIVSGSLYVREGGQVHATPLVGESPLLGDLLKRRYEDSFG